MFAYCGNNPVMYTDSTGTVFFTALGGITGFISGGLTAMMTGEPKEVWFDIAVKSAVGGAIAGAGVDVGLLLIGSCGTAAPVVAMAYGVAFMAGGIGNAYTTYAVSDGTATDEDLAVSFVTGGAFNMVSLGTSTSATASSVNELVYLGGKDLSTNLKTGAFIAISTSLATTVGTGVGNELANQRISMLASAHALR